MFHQKIFFSQSLTDSLKFILFHNLFDFVITNIFKSIRDIFLHDWISFCSFSRLFKLRRTKEHSKTKSHHSEWLYVYFIERYIHSRSSEEIIHYEICLFSDDERYYRCMIDNLFISINLIIDSLFWSLERLSSFDFKNDLLSKLIEFIINLLNDHFVHLCRSESLIIFSKNSMNVLKKNQSLESLKSFSFDINVFNFKYLS